MYKALHDLLPAYLAEDYQLVSVTGCQRLHSSDIDTCLAQRTNILLGDRSFTAAGPRIWNSLPTQLCESDITLGQFRQAFIMHRFGYWQLQHEMTMFFVHCVQIGLVTYLIIFIRLGAGCTKRVQLTNFQLFLTDFRWVCCTKETLDIYSVSQ